MQWLQNPHVKEFWQETDDPVQFRKKFLEEMPRRSMEARIVEWRGRLIGYIQSYEASKVGGGWWPEEKAGTFGVDQFIGEPDCMGKGLGSAFLREFVQELFSRGAKEIITDPDPKNPRAIRAYEKVGFRREGALKTPGGDAVLLRLLPGSAPRE